MWRNEAKLMNAFRNQLQKTIVFQLAYFVFGPWLRDGDVTIRNQSCHYRQKMGEFNTDALRRCKKTTRNATIGCIGLR